MKNMTAIEKAAETIPVFIRDEKTQKVQLQDGCFDCEHRHGLDPHRRYMSFLIENEDPNFDIQPLVAFTISWDDRWMIDNHNDIEWLRLHTDFIGVFSRWHSVERILRRTPELFVRLWNGFDGRGVRHVNSRMSLAHVLEDYEERDVLVWSFHPGGYSGVYVEPTDELRNVGEFDNEQISAMLRASSVSMGQRARANVVDLFPNASNRLRRLGGDNLKEDDGRDTDALDTQAVRAMRAAIERDRERVAAREALRRTQAVHEERLIEVGQGRRPRVDRNVGQWLTYDLQANDTGNNIAQTVEPDTDWNEL